ncbi:MAG TPA: glyoxalase [Gammaproteobacteria bacterium]|jgi:predicted enzyme related to lactoylglutathione lyase|nr:glyoxalase [Acidiferrobacteraceae bacterium]MDP6399578.1 VOC family protein [Arenicellales bacterium]HCX87472.1 glyoxalase [Gammaproteobacteria bacterium]MDP6552894.1 VOC family protein [Arenicellales bacterium]MDP6791032.1 VOC family protein [Arenicellales bacterium]|tara:strand:+ start:1094 stop:1468 length:375 start_codon:yes stop_codon:yes gene_type:complete
MSFDSFITFLPTRDLVQTARFYEDVLKLELALDQTRCRIYRVAKGGFLGFCLKDEVKQPEGVILTLVTEDVDHWQALLAEHDVPIETAPVFNPEYQIYQMFLRDPNGYLIEVQRFEDPRWNAQP